MPVPSVADWEWLNWKFPRPVHSGETIYARWTLTQKRPPVAGAASAIVVWRVDVHTADGAMCAEGEVGAKVKRDLKSRPQPSAEQPAPAAAPRRRRSRGGRSRPNGAAVLPEPPPVAAPPAAAAKPERAAGPSRRRRRRRPSGSAERSEEHEPRAAHVSEVPPPPAPGPPPEAVATRGSTGGRKGIGGVLRRLRGTQS